MTGVFDSGAGGLAALTELRRLLPKEDIVFLADRKNAPYGTKIREEIISIAEENIKRLTDLGAGRVLIACCTASAFHKELRENERAVSIPVIAPAAKQAVKVSKNGRIAVIATELTVKSGAFTRAIKEANGDAEIFELPAQRLVEISEKTASGVLISATEQDYLSELADEISNYKIDTLVLGCTHFSHLGKKINELLKDVSIVDSALLGAEAIAAHASGGTGKTVLL